MKQILKLCKFNLLVKRKAIMGWSLCIFSVMTLYMVFFPSIQDVASIKFEVMPQEVLQFVGMEDLTSLDNYTNYFGTIYALVLVAVSIFSATFSAGLITKAEQDKSIEFMNSLPVTRTELFIAKYLTSTIAVGLVLTCAILAVIGCGFLVGGESFSLMDVVACAKITSFSALLFGAIALSLAGVSSKVGTAATASGVVLAAYMLGYLGQLLGEDGELLKYFSPFLTLSVEQVLENSSELYIGLGIYFFLYLLALIIGGVLYNRRDLKI